MTMILKFLTDGTHQLKASNSLLTGMPGLLSLKRILNLVLFSTGSQCNITHGILN